MKISKEKIACFSRMLIEDDILLLCLTLEKIEECDKNIFNELSRYEAKFYEKFSKNPDKYFDLKDEFFVKEQIIRNLYGSFAITLASKVEDILEFILLNNNHAQKLTFAKCMEEIEKRYDCKKEDLMYYEKHIFVRELSNRFKHSGGKTQENLLKNLVI
ncbi:MAG: hypothetical protein H7A34_00775 [bacterium]|nr:hypothetical protein [bacterium]